MSDVKDISADLKEYMELKATNVAQYKTIVELSKKIQEKEKEINHLKSMLESTVPIFEKTENISSPLQLSGDDEETICRTQIRLLREIALKDELTLEQTKKFEIYAKTLMNIKNTPQVIEVKSKKLSDAELLAALNQLEGPKDERQ